MNITKMSLPRRTVLRGLGATVALPLLDAMVPAFTATAKTAASPVKRFGAIYVSNGMAMEYWTPKTEGAGFEFMPVVASMAPFRDQVLMLSGMKLPWDAPHPSGPFLSGATGNRGESNIVMGVSMDQIVAKEAAQHTQLASLELAMENVGNTGQCSTGYSCVYSNTISWRDRTTPLPMENNPRVVFERMFGDSSSTDASARVARLRQDRSLLDSMLESVAGLKRKIGAQDRGKVEQYLEGVRDVERRLQKAEEQQNKELPVVEKPAGIPATYGEHAKLMFDLQLLAFQCDLTRVITFMMCREQSSLTYPEVGVPDAHHPLSHHNQDPERISLMSKINAYHVGLFADFVQKLKSTPDGDGNLLDNSMILYGAGLSNSMDHLKTDLPMMLVGGGGGTIKGGRHLRYPAKTPVSDLLVTMMDKLGVQVDKLGDSDGPLQLDSAVTL